MVEIMASNHMLFICHHYEGFQQLLKPSFFTAPIEQTLKVNQSSAIVTFSAVMLSTDVCRLKLANRIALL